MKEVLGSSGALYRNNRVPDNNLGTRDELVLDDESPVMKPNQIRHSQNLAIYDGFYHGKFYRDGIVQQSKK